MKSDQRLERPPGSVLPDSTWSWLIVGGNVILGVTSLGYFRTIPVFFRSLMMEFDVDYGDVASIPGLFCFGLAVGSFFLPFLTSKFGSKATCLVTGVVMSASNAVSAFSYSLILIQALYGFVSGFCTGILFFTSVFASSQYFIKHRAKATGISTLGVPLGTLILAPIADLLITAYGWRGAMLIFSGIILNSCVSASLFRPVVLPRPVERRKSRTNSVQRQTSQPMISPKDITDRENNFNQIVEEVISGGGDLKFEYEREKLASGGRDLKCEKTLHDQLNSDIRRRDTNWTAAKRKLKSAIDYKLFKSISYDIGIISTIFYFCGYVTTNTFLVPLGMDFIGLGSFEASTLLSFVCGAECIAKVITGFMADAKRINKCLLLAVMAVACSVSVACMTFCRSYASLAATSLAYGLFVTAYVGIITVIYCDILGPHKIATAVGYQGFIYNIFLAPCLYLMGRLVDATGDVRRIFYVCASFIAVTSLCLLVIYWLQRRKKIIKEKVLDEDLKVIEK